MDGWSEEANGVLWGDRAVVVTWPPIDGVVEVLGQSDVVTWEAEYLPGNSLQIARTSRPQPGRDRSMSTPVRSAVTTVVSTWLTTAHSSFRSWAIPHHIVRRFGEPGLGRRAGVAAVPAVVDQNDGETSLGEGVSGWDPAGPVTPVSGEQDDHRCAGRCSRHSLPGCRVVSTGAGDAYFDPPRGGGPGSWAGK